MTTASAARSRLPGARVRTVASLIDGGQSISAIRANVDARRWQRFGRVVALHNAPPSLQDRRAIALLNCGPRALLTAFSAAEEHGLEGWQRDTTHVLVPGGRRVVRLHGVPVHLHYRGPSGADQSVPGRRLHRAAPALLLAAATFPGPRPACGILAAAVQQRVVTPDDLQTAIVAAPRIRHRLQLIAAVCDIAQGAQALSEIDFARLCRRHGLPEPVRQAVRVEPGGRRRYLDVEWLRRDGHRVVAEIDGALHLASRSWWDDQLRQNELAITGAVVLRFPSVVVRTEPHLVIDQLRRVLQ